mgnify:CR=1 FL=1
MKNLVKDVQKNLKIIDHTKIVSTLYQETDRFTDKFLTNIINIFKNKPNNAIIVDTIDSKIPEFSKIKDLQTLEDVI